MAKQISSRVEQIPESATIKISDLAATLRNKGKEVISFSLGEPNFRTPKRIIDAAKQSLDRGDTHYTPSQGIPVLREAIAQKLKVANNLDVSSADIIVTPGAKQAIFEAMGTLLNPGDEVILFDPAWVSYEAITKFYRSTPVMVPVYEENGFQPEDVQNFITPKTKIIVLNSPCNPTGAVYNEQVISSVADVANDNDVYVISDEVYEKIIYDDYHFSIGALIPDLTITINGFSKAYAMTGWRLGYAAAPYNIVPGMLKIQQHSVSHPTSFVQYAGVEALTGDQTDVSAMTRKFQQRRDLVVDELSKIGIACQKPKGAFYVFVDISQYGTSMGVTERLLEEGNVAVIPGAAFGPNGEGYIRMSYAASTEHLIAGIGRIERALLN